MNEWRGAVHLRDPPEGCKCVRERTDLNSEGDERATSKVIVMVTCPVGLKSSPVLE